MLCCYDSRFLDTLSADGALWQLFIALTNAAYLLPSVLSLACHLHLLPAFMCSGLVCGSVLSRFSRCWHYALSINLPLTVRATSCLLENQSRLFLAYMSVFPEEFGYLQKVLENSCWYSLQWERTFPHCVCTKWEGGEAALL